VCLVIALTPAVAGAQAHEIAEPFAKGSTVQLQGCVVEGEQRGTFVFSRVTAWPVASPNGEFGPRFFWLINAAKQLEQYLGQTVQVTGTVSEIRESEIERNPGYDSRNGRRVAIELPTGDVFTTPELAGIRSADPESRVDMKVTLIGVKVESLLVVMSKCLAPFR
jgi:hypothetical protein